VLFTRSRCLSLLVVCLAAASSALAQNKPVGNPLNEPLGNPGVVPTDAEGKPLNFNFETGTLDGWTATGKAWEGQPVRGDISTLRPADGKKSEQTGQFWIGGYEKLGDEPTGSLTSPTFEAAQPYASFLIGGGSLRETRVELVTADDNKVFFTARGKNEENLRPAIVNLTPQIGKKIFIRLVDQSRGGWGHVNFDDFRLHAQRPRFKSTAGELPVPEVAALYPHAGLSGDEAAKAMVVPPGFSVQCAAQEPDVKQPIAMAIDDRGRIWIAEAYNYPTRGGDGEGKDRILVLEDTDLDGNLDKRTVFIEGLNLVSGLEVGFGGVWVGAAPYLLFIPDRNYDDVPDAPPAEYKLPDGLQFPKDVPSGATVLLDGFGWHDTHETLNSFIWGPDGWLYGCHGVFTHSKVGKPGTPDEKREPLNAGIWRYHPVRHEFEVFAEGTSNPWGVDYNQYGDFFATACVIPHLYHIIPGGRYQRQAGQHFNPYTYDDIKTIAEHRHYTGNQWNDDNRRQSDTLGGGHAHAGAMIYQGGAWPEKYHGQLFMNNIHGNRLNVDVLTPKGSGYTGTFSPDFLLTRDQASQMLYLTYGPDGQVWVIDWYDMQACHRPDPNVHDRSNGRIYRIVYGDAKPVKVDLQKLKDEELVQLLRNDNHWYRRHAQRILQERAMQPGSSLLWTIPGMISSVLGEPRQELDQLQEFRTGTVVQQAASYTQKLPEGTVTLGENIGRNIRAFTKEFHDKPQARRLLHENTFEWHSGTKLELHPNVVEALAEVAQNDNSPHVRLTLASGLRRLQPKDRWSILEALTSHPEDAADHNLPLMYWYAMEPLADVDPARALALAMTAGENIPILKEFMIRRIGAGDPAKSLALLVEGLKKADDDTTRLAFVCGIGEAVKGRKDVPAPADLGGLLKEMAFQPGGSEDLQSRCLSLAVTFGQPEVIEGLRKTIREPNGTAKSKRLAIQIMADHRDKESIGPIRTALASADLRQDALRALAVYDDPQIPAAILSVYGDLSAAERRDALTTLASRPAYGGALLDAVAGGKVPANHLTADLVTNLRNLNDEGLSKRIESVWGIVRSSPEDVAKQIAAYKQLVDSTAGQASSGTPRPSPLAPHPSLEEGRAVFAKTCQVCHTLFGTGAKIGPDLTGSNRQNLDYLLQNIVDPSAVMAKEYQPLVVRLEDGRVITGIKKEETADSLTLVTQNESLTVAKDEIMEQKQSEKSMMPDNQLTQFTPHGIRSLVAYLQAGGQTPMLATADNVGTFFNGENLAGWVGDAKLWSVENGEIVGKTDGLAKNEFLISELSVGDFRLELDVKLLDNEGNSGIQIRSQPIAGGEMKGYQADIGAGWWGKLYEEHGRALLEAKGGEEFVKKGDWNRYEIVAAGSRVRTWINGNLCVDRDDPEAARLGVIGLQLHSGGKTEVRFKNLKLSLLPSHVPALPYPVSKPAAEGTSSKVSFKRTKLDPAFRSEGVGMGDFNNDGLLDISAGSVWYENPGQIRNPKSEIRNSPALTPSPSTSPWPMHVLAEKPNSFDIKTYGDTFMNWAEDVDGDCRLDLVVVDFPGKQTWWFKNPGHANKDAWQRNVVVQVTNDESPMFVDVDGDGNRELIFGDGANRLALARPEANPLLEWKQTPIATKADADIQRFYHGLGVGDINKDGRPDVLVPGGWCEAPGTATTSRGSGEWTFHAAPFGPAQAQMYVFDFDGDGDNDVVGSSAHQRGIWWYEQDGDSWKQHKIDDSIAQTHALVLADMNGDGLPDLVTGKRYYAHNGRDPGEDEAPELAWYELSREMNAATGDSDKAATSGRVVPKWTKHLVDSDSGVGTQFEVHDMNADGLLDIVVANKHGVYYFEQTRK
jgi:putative membrane-bound dehydrogenase-like protein